MKKKTCCFTGHRPQSLPFGFNENDARCDALKKALREQIIHLIEKEMSPILFPAWQSALICMPPKSFLT